MFRVKQKRSRYMFVCYWVNLFIVSHLLWELASISNSAWSQPLMQRSLVVQCGRVGVNVLLRIFESLFLSVVWHRLHKTLEIQNDLAYGSSRCASEGKAHTRDDTLTMHNEVFYGEWTFEPQTDQTGNPGIETQVSMLALISEGGGSVQILRRTVFFSRLNVEYWVATLILGRLGFLPISGSLWWSLSYFCLTIIGECSQPASQTPCGRSTGPVHSPGFQPVVIDLLDSSTYVNDTYCDAFVTFTLVPEELDVILRPHLASQQRLRLLGHSWLESNIVWRRLPRALDEGIRWRWYLASTTFPVPPVESGTIDSVTFLERQ